MSEERAEKDGGATAMRDCWSCGTAVAMRAPFCHACGVIQAPQPVDHFTRLNLPARFDLQMADIERQYFGLQRYFHPDRFAAKPARERALSSQHATDLNEAYAVVKDPLRRAEYLLVLKGRPVQGDACSTISDPRVLLEAMEMREELAEAQSATEIEGIIARVEGECEAVLDEVADAFAREAFDLAGRHCIRLRYLTKLAAEAHERRARLEA
ncbi:MAG: Fe-S protein assembly co-chaperone HscB [Alphaproteobacteria bacterium]|nr:Fe-S protein assembly co-chaperone HscB [Alphaproteobacteria bacterium]